jgi:hypothetical protein
MANFDFAADKKTHGKIDLCREPHSANNIFPTAEKGYREFSSDRRNGFLT